MRAADNMGSKQSEGQILDAVGKFRKNQDKAGRLIAASGGVTAFISMCVAIYIIGMDFVLGFGGQGILISRPLVGMWLGLMGLLGGVMTWRNTKIPGMFALASGIVGLLPIPVYFAVGGVLLILGSLLMLTSTTRSSTE